MKCDRCEPSVCLLAPSCVLNGALATLGRNTCRHMPLIEFGRWNGSGVRAWLLVATCWVQACAPSGDAQCSEVTCFGCCAADGTCQSGDTSAACGAREAQCVACEPGSDCHEGKCARTITGVDRLTCTGFGNVEGTVNATAFLGRNAWASHGQGTIRVVVTDSSSATPSDPKFQTRLFELMFDFKDGAREYSSQLDANTFRPALLRRYIASDPMTMRMLYTELGESGFLLEVTELVFASESGRCDGVLRGNLFVSEQLRLSASGFTARGPVAVPLFFTREDLRPSCGATDAACAGASACCSGYCRPSSGTCQ